MRTLTLTLVGEVAAGGFGWGGSGFARPKRSQSANPTAATTPINKIPTAVELRDLRRGIVEADMWVEVDSERATRPAVSPEPGSGSRSGGGGPWRIAAAMRSASIARSFENNRSMTAAVSVLFGLPVS